MEKVSIMSQLLLEDVSLMRILMARMLPMMNYSTPMKKFALKNKNKGSS